MSNDQYRLVTSRLKEHALERPDQIAIRCGVNALTYARLFDRVETCVQFVRSHTYAGDRVGIEIENSLNFVVWFLAIAQTGRIAMVLDTDWTPDVRKSVLERSPAEVIVDGTTDPLQGLSENPHVDSVSSYADFYIGFTSGTTGLPKGFRRSHRSWVLSFLADEKEFHVRPDHRILAPGSMVHSLFLYAVIHGLFVGATVDVLTHFSPRTMLDVLRERQISHLYVVPAMLSNLDRHEDFARVPTLRAILSGGAKLTPEVRTTINKKLPLVDVVEFFGASETSYIAIARTAEGAPAKSIGRPFHGVSISIRRDDGTETNVNEEGRLFVKSDLIFSGYEGGDNGKLLRDGEWISVRDRVYRDEKGFLYLVGRENRMIVSSGRNIYPEQIELALQRHETIAACAVLGLDDSYREQELVAVLEFKSRAIPTARDLRGFLKEQLPSFQIPHRFFLVSELPRTTSGKIRISTLERQSEQEWTLLS